MMTYPRFAGAGATAVLGLATSEPIPAGLCGTGFQPVWAQVTNLCHTYRDRFLVRAQSGTPGGESMTNNIHHARTNRLINSTSPYLLQHAHNPVDWYPWGPEAFAKAAKENKPIFLSIGYAACHWCHVMEQESFESEDIAALLNEYFVAIKVDREERPDVDEIYMHVTVQMTGSGGWPMSVFLTPDKVPFYAGTYFPPSQFRALITRLAEAWSDQRQEIVAHGEQLRRQVEEWARGAAPGADVISLEAVTQNVQTLARYFDTRYGGISGGGTNKFPPSMTMELILREHARGGDAKLLHLVELTLDHMARGGIYDHLGGGICRYSTDERWLVPHFEKMLYDQALVSSIYLDAYQVTGKRQYAEVAAGILDYVLADLTSPQGGFYSTRDADSEGLEGAYYIWTVDQIHEVLGPEEGKLFCEFYDVTPQGNWFESRGHAPAGPKNILNAPIPLAEFAARRSLDADELGRRLGGMRAKLLAVRSRRLPPALDDKILTGWNGLMIASLAKGARVLDRPEYAEAAARAADFVLANLQNEGRLLRTCRDGRSHLTGYLSDYAFFIEGLLNLHEATFELHWLESANSLSDTLIQHYYDEQNGGFFFTADDAEELLTRTKNQRDGAIPSGNSVQALNLLRLAALLDRKDYRDRAESIFRAFKPEADRSVGSFERLMCAVDFYHSRPREIALAGDPSEPATQALIRAVYSRYLPNKVVALADGSADRSARLIPLLKGKSPVNGQATAYVCRNQVCRRPVSSPEELAEQLDAD